MIYRDDISNLRQDIIGKEGQKIIVKGALGRSKFFEKEATLEKAYPNLFVVKYNKEEGNATYSYTDVLTRTIELQVFDGENYSSIIPEKVEIPKKNEEDTNVISEKLD
ncbi:MAG: Veg protein [Clostridia bacterium]|jgi:uncharacterized protein Veg|nr:Veg protein [Clostridia bacterium]